MTPLVLKRNAALLMYGALLLITSCDPSTETESIVTWKKVLQPESRSLFNSLSKDDELVLLSAGEYIRNVDHSGTGVQYYFLDNYLGQGRYKFPLALNYFVHTDVSSLILHSAVSDPAQSVKRTLDVKTLDEDFYEFIDIPYWQGECIQLVEDNHILIPYKAVHEGVAVNSPRFALVKVHVPIANDEELEIENVALIKEDLFPGFVNVYRLQSFDGFFFVTMGDATYRISTEGNMVKVADLPLNIIETPTALYAFALPSHSSEDLLVLKSINSGSDWTELYTVTSFSPVLSLSFVTSGDLIFGYRETQIFQLQLTDADIFLTEVRSEGLPEGRITSLAITPSDEMLVTLACQLAGSECGAYTMPMDQLFK